MNKFDLVGFDRQVFERICAEYCEFASDLGFTTIAPIPMSARYGDNVTRRSDEMPWYSGSTLLEHLENVAIDDAAADNRPFRLPIQYVNRPNQDFRGFAGTVASGAVNTGEAVVAAKSGRRSRVKRILVGAADHALASAGQSVTLLLEDEIDISRGDVLTAVDARPEVADQFQASIVWFDEKPLLPGRSYTLRTETDQAGATVTNLKHRINVTNFAKEAAHAKLFTTDMAMKHVSNALQIHGGAGYSKHYRIERIFRDIKLAQIYEGTNQIQRLIIARQIDKEMS